MKKRLSPTILKAANALTIPRITDFGESRMEDLPALNLSHALWSDSDHPCSVKVRLWHSGESLYIWYEVEEAFLKAQKRAFNEEVHLDNCVEFFIRFAEEENYYNFEFNCLGSIKGAYGNSRHDRSFLPPQILASIADQLQLSIERDGTTGLFCWSLLVKLDTAVFCHTGISDFRQLSCFMNFTKCGDELPEPHFISWAGLPSSEPDFHQPEYFREVLMQ